MTNHTPSILCVELDPGVLETRCALLSWAGYHVTYALPQLAETILRSRRFDLIVASSLGKDVLLRITHRAGRTPILVLDEFTAPSKLIDKVGRWLNQKRRA